MMDFGEVLAGSWKAFWKNKVLWLFGLIPPLVYVIVLVVGMLFVFNNRFLDSVFNANSFGPGITPAVLVFFLFFFLFLIVYMFVNFYADAAIVKGTLDFDQAGQKRSVAELLRESRPYYWRVAALLLLLSVAVGIEVVILWLVMFLAIALTLGLGFICVMPLILLTVPLNMLAMALIEMSKALLIHGNLSIGESLGRGWMLLKGNFWNVVLLVLIQFVIGAVVGTIMYIPMYAVFFIPMMTMMNSGSASSPDFPVRMMEMMKWVYVIVLPVFALIQSLMQTFFRILWVVATVRLAKHSGPSPVPADSPVQLGTI